ncbi:MAG: hypothetical protein IIX57_03650 [Lachnospiraceae bacterium]|nr:hypothetical protein [Lachnospiraceae bacterium]
MAEKRGRKDAYEIRIKPRFDEIRDWLINGASDDNIIHNLGISKPTFYKYINEKIEFSNLIKNGRIAIVAQLRSALIKKAMGFEYSETKIIEREDPDTGEKVKTVETYNKKALPDVAALNLALKNYDPDNWSNDPQGDKIKREELELKKQKLEKDDW